MENINHRFYDEAKRNNKKIIVICLLIFVGFSIYAFADRKDSASMAFLDTYMKLSVIEDGTASEILVNYDDILNVATRYEDTALDLGRMVEGVQTHKLWCGMWENDEFGIYSLYVNPKLETYTIITTTDGVLVVNIEGKVSTENFSDALVQLLTDESYWTTSNGK